jgi:DNA-binding sugar fermentation-stimulating protein
VIELARAIDEGYRACVLFVIQRTESTVFAPNDETNPKFGEALREAATKGVEVYAYSARLREINYAEGQNSCKVVIVMCICRRFWFRSMGILSL